MILITNENGEKNIDFWLQFFSLLALNKNNNRSKQSDYCAKMCVFRQFFSGSDSVDWSTILGRKNRTIPFHFTRSPNLPTHARKVSNETTRASGCYSYTRSNERHRCIRMFPKKKTKTKCYTQRSYSRDPQQHNKNVGTWQPNEEKSGSKKNNGRKKLNNFNLKLIKLTKMGKFDACCVQKMPNTKTRRAHNATKHAVTQCTSIQTRSRKTKQRNTKKTVY